MQGWQACETVVIDDESDPTLFSRALAGFPFKLEIAHLNVGLSIALSFIVTSDLDV